MKNKKQQNIDQNQPEESSEQERNREPYKNRPLPGEYPPDEDIMNRLNKVERTAVDPDNLSRNSGADNSRVTEEFPEAATFPSTTNTKKAATDSNLTKEDFEALGPRDLSMDGGDDEQLRQRVWPVDFAARDLDVPKGDEEREDAQGRGDEENDHYSLGGDDKDSLEDDPTTTFG